MQAVNSHPNFINFALPSHPHAFEVIAITNAQWKAEEAGFATTWEYDLAKCCKSTFIQGDGEVEGQQLYLCGNVFCHHTACIANREKKFLRNHGYLYDNNIQIEKIQRNNFYTADGVREAFKELQEAHDALKREGYRYVLFAGKNWMWLVTRNKEKTKLSANDLKNAGDLIDDFMDLSDVFDEDARQTLMEEKKGRRRIRMRGFYQRKQHIRKVPTILVNGVRRALKRKRREVDVDAVADRDIQHFVYFDIREPRYRVFNIRKLEYQLLTFEELIANPENKPEVEEYFGRDFLTK